jgi:hypothetical protein
MKRSTIAIIILGLFPGCAAVQGPHLSPSPGKHAGLPIDPEDIMDDTSGIFDSFMDSGDSLVLPVESDFLHLKLKLAVVDPHDAVDDIVAVAATNHGSADIEDSGHLDLCVPIGALKAVLAGINSLGNISELVYAGHSLAGDFSGARTRLGKTITAADLVLHLLDGSQNFFTYAWVRDETIRAVDLMRKRLEFTMGRLQFASIAVTLIAARPNKPGIIDHAWYLVKGIGGMLKR